MPVNRMLLPKVKIQGLYALPQKHEPATPAVLDTMAGYLRRYRGKLLGLTGAGVSVSSGIPDYRGVSGTYRIHGEHKPILHHELVTQHSFRQRYWARSFFGIRPAFKAQPNAIHQALATLESTGYLAGLISQNVDGLHLAAGSRNMLELHGTLKQVRCLSCGHQETRDEFQLKLDALNPDWTAFHQEIISTGQEPPRRPDGDVDLPISLRYEDFVYPRCESCGTGHYMPTVVFFGGHVSEDVRDRAYQMVDQAQAQALLVCGTSLATFSAYRLVKRAYDQGKDILLVNVGQTRGDMEATVKLETAIEELLPPVVKSIIGDTHTNYR